ncbi:hypothetical protein VPH35_087613 [Triticum aestivum]
MAALAQAPLVPAPAQHNMALFDWRPLFRRTRPSVFLAVFTPVIEQDDDAWALARAAGSKTPEELDQIFESEWLTETGISSHMDGNYLYILNTAHIVDHLFHAVNRFFTIEVTCYHAETDFAVGRNRVGPRTYTPATVCGIDCLRDLMMLRGRVQCTQPHPVLRFDGASQLGMQCMLFSWPAFRPCTFATGLQCLHRFLTGMSTNLVGYDMELLEAYVGSDQGSLGGHLFNSAGLVKGILHGWSGTHSQFILPADIIALIQMYAVPPPPPSPSASPSPPRGLGGGGGGPKRGPKKDDKPGPSDPPKRCRSARDKGKAAATWGSGRRYVLRSHGKGMAVGAGGSGQKYLLN